MISELIQQRYPKTITLKDGTHYVLRPSSKKDMDILWGFFQEIPDNDKLFLKDNIVEKDVVAAWCNSLNYESVLPLLALHDGKLVGDATLHTHQRTWVKHIGKIRVTIHPKYRNRGLASMMVKELIEIASKTDLEILDAEFMSEQESAINAFKKLGFKQLALMDQYVIDTEGKPHDFIILGLALK
jgi:RimJ/RimL family protein N-acetyltransferase